MNAIQIAWRRIRKDKGYSLLHVANDCRLHDRLALLQRGQDQPGAEPAAGVARNR